MIILITQSLNLIECFVILTSLNVNLMYDGSELES